MFNTININVGSVKTINIALSTIKIYNSESEAIEIVLLNFIKFITIDYLKKTIIS